MNTNLNSRFVNEIHGTEKLLDLIPVADYVSLHTAAHDGDQSNDWI